MDYEQKYYKEALKWMQGLYSGLHGATKEVAEHYFPELKESEDERKAIIRILKGETGYTSKEDIDKYVAWLEKQGEQMTKLKFHEGDWILNDVCYPLQIASIKDGMYIFTEGDAMSVSFVDEHLHLWTIKDAEDGDVLVGKDGRPFIFTGEFDVQDDNPTAYCGINSSDKFITGNGSHWTFKDGIKPATKEQHDLLFQKMEEAGYEWDSEKKELKQNEVKKEVKKLDSDKVIEWLKNTIRERAENYGVYKETRLTLPYNSIEDLINDFKEDFGL